MKGFADVLFILIYSCCLCATTVAATQFAMGGLLPRILSVIVGVEQVSSVNYSFRRNLIF